VCPLILRHMSLPCCLSVNPYVPICLHPLPPNFEAYEITLLPLCPPMTPFFFRFLCGPCRVKGKQAISFFLEHVVMFMLLVLCSTYINLIERGAAIQINRHNAHCWELSHSPNSPPVYELCILHNKTWEVCKVAFVFFTRLSVSWIV
jgi:hypothetical protein